MTFYTPDSNFGIYESPYYITNLLFSQIIYCQAIVFAIEDVSHGKITQKKSDN